MATWWPARAATSRMRRMRGSCSSWVPCEKLIRATLSPASMRSRMASRDDEEGPSVQTILVRGKLLGDDT